MIKNKIKELAAKYKDEFIKVRHHLHANPHVIDCSTEGQQDEDGVDRLRDEVSRIAKIAADRTEQRN